jgi:hypothetical protein
MEILAKWGAFCATFGFTVWRQGVKRFRKSAQTIEIKGKRMLCLMGKGLPQWTGQFG